MTAVAAAGSRSAPEPLIEVDSLVKVFGRSGWRFRRRNEVLVRAVDDVSLRVRPGETVSLVGESGSGKTTVARAVLGLEMPTSGEVRYLGQPIQRLSRERRAQYRQNVQAVFQDPWSSLDPRMRVRRIIAEPLRASGRQPRHLFSATTASALESVGLPPEAAHRFPHEFSGGQRQRVAIARALSVAPSLIVLDEPVSALDISIRAQIVILLRELQASTGTAYLMVAHDLSTVQYMGGQVVVMYRGRQVESGRADQILTSPRHPYTQALVEAAKVVVPGEDWVEDPASTVRLPGRQPVSGGCVYSDRCPIALAECSTILPPVTRIAAGHDVACHAVRQTASGVVQDDVGDRADSERE